MITQNIFKFIRNLSALIPSAIYVLGRYPPLLDDVHASVTSSPSFTDHELRACVQRTCETDEGKVTK